MSVLVRKTEGETPAKTSVPAHTNPILGLREEIDRLFDDYFAAPFGRLSDFAAFRGLGAFPSLGDMTPHVDVKDTEAAIEIIAELPGLEEKDIEVTIENGTLSMKGEKKVEREEKGADWLLSERRYGAFHRTFRLPDTVDEDKVAARFDKGVLTLTLPKTVKPAKEARKIEVQAK